MRLVLIDDAGQVAGAVEGVEGYDLDRPLAAAALVDEIKNLVCQAVSDGRSARASRVAFKRALAAATERAAEIRAEGRAD